MRKLFEYSAFEGRKGGTRKIAELPKEKKCKDPEHNPATMILRKPGIYEHECPSCHEKQVFTVPANPELSSRLH